MTEIDRALADIAEVRECLAMTQRFRGYSGAAAVLSGLFALVAGVIQAVLVPMPSGRVQEHLYATIWSLCCAAALVVNYGAIARWFASDASARERWQTRTVGLAILPALLLGSGLTLALLARGNVGFLPAVWYGCYGVGLFASRSMVPRAVMNVAGAFLGAGLALLALPTSASLQWWVVPLGFGIGQIAIGIFILQERLTGE